MLIAEYDYDTDIAVQREEAGRIAFAEGREQGITQGSRKKSSAFWVIAGKYRASNRPNRIGDRNAGIMDDAFSAVS